MRPTSPDGLLPSVPLDPDWLAGLSELQRAFAQAEADGVDVWQLAVELPQLRQQGLTHTTLRLLVKEGILLQAEEIARSEAGHRRYRPVAILGMPERSCFVFTDDGLTWLAGRRANGHACAAPGREEVPRWLRGNGVLLFGGLVVKKFTRPAPLQFLLLDAFEADRWQHHTIPNPLSQQGDGDRYEQMQAAIKKLNRRQRHPLIRFGGNGRGDGVCWYRCGGDGNERKPR